MATRKSKNLVGTDAVQMLESWTRDDAATQARLAEERAKAAVARQIYQLRTTRGLTQKQLAEMIGTKQPVIARLEDADYQGHSLAILFRIAAALGCSLSVGFTARSRAARRKAHQAPPRLPAQRPQVKTR